MRTSPQSAQRRHAKCRRPAGLDRAHDASLDLEVPGLRLTIGLAVTAEDSATSSPDAMAPFDQAGGTTSRRSRSSGWPCCVSSGSDGRARRRRQVTVAEQGLMIRISVPASSRWVAKRGAACARPRLASPRPCRLNGRRHATCGSIGRLSRPGNSHWHGQAPVAAQDRQKVATAWHSGPWRPCPLRPGSSSGAVDIADLQPHRLRGRARRRTPWSAPRLFRPAPLRESARPHLHRAPVATCGSRLRMRSGRSLWPSVTP
jgi:hypothetical protein